jgi:hypothetical protein
MIAKLYISLLHTITFHAITIIDNMHYVACWVEMGCLRRCLHKHWTISEADACEDVKGIVIHAVGPEGERSLNEEEVDEYKRFLRKRFAQERAS